MSLMLALPLAQMGMAGLPETPAPADIAVPASLSAAPPPATPTLTPTAQVAVVLPPAQAAAAPAADPAPPPADPAAPPAPDTTADPLHGFNRISHAITQPIDALILRPVAIVYKTVFPEPLRDGARNALANLFAPTVLANDILQLRPDRALRTILRFAINSTLGVAGLFDMARRHPFKLAGHSNGFGDTLGYYGVGPGAYVYLPVLGPTTLRDMTGLVGDAFTEPLLLDHFTRQNTQVVGTGRRKRSVTVFNKGIQVSTYGLAIMVVSGVDARAQNDQALQVIKTQSVDPYAALRSSYLQDRAGQIAALKAKDGAQAKIPAFDDPLEDPAGGGGKTP